jgi:hypothetical protein
MLHEHESPYGGIKWNRQAVYTWARETQGWDEETTDENILNTYATNEISGSVFDPDSVMLYFFPASLTLNNQGTKQNLRYSKTDLEWLASTYGSTYNPNLLGGAPAPAPAGSLFHSSLFWIVLLAVAVAALVFFLTR